MLTFSSAEMTDIQVVFEMILGQSCSLVDFVAQN